MDFLKIKVDEDKKIRLDRYLAKKIDGKSRTYIQNLIKNNRVKVNDKFVKPRYLVKENDYITVNFPKPKGIKIKPEKIPLDIIYEDFNIAVINKAGGILVHPTDKVETGTLVNGLVHQFRNLSNYGGRIRPGIVHRLDKDTSGLLIIAKDNYSHERLNKNFQKRNIKRIYHTLVFGNVEKDSGWVESLIGRDPSNRTRMAVVKENGKFAKTYYKVLKRFGDYTLLEIRLVTGRTHQIRVHMASMGHPVVGDLTYSNRKAKFNIGRHLLHAKRIGFLHPVKKNYIEIDSCLPGDFEELLKALDKF